MLRAAFVAATLACCAMSTAAQDVTAKQVKLALAGSPLDFAVTWQTKTLGDGYTPAVFFGTDSANLTSVAKGYSLTYNDNESFQHRVILSSLLPATKYFYRVANATQEGASDVFSFRTTTPGQTALRIAAFGDMGITGSEANLARLIANKDSFDAMIHVGDISYADDRQVIPLGPNPKYESVYNEYLDRIEPLTASLPYHVCPGNHDAACHSAGNLGCPPSQLNFTAFRHRFRMPSEESGGVENMWYSFTIGNVFFVSISTETDYDNAPEGHNTLFGPAGGPFGDQISWLRATLQYAQAHRKQFPWLIVYGHRPMYSATTGEFPAKAQPQLRVVMEDLFYEAGVDVFLSGHVHSYQRHWPVYKSTADKTYNNPKFPVHIVNGAGGNTEGLTAHFPVKAEWKNTNFQADWGYGVFDVHNNTALTYSFIAAKSGDVADTFTLVKDHA